MGQNDVIESVRRYKQLVLDNLGQARVYLFGSYSKGTAREDSDIDVAVVVPKVEDDFLKTSSMLWMLTWNIKKYGKVCYSWQEFWLSITSTPQIRESCSMNIFPR